MYQLFSSKFIFALVVVGIAGYGFAQPFVWPSNYAPTAQQGGTIREVSIGDFSTFNIVLSETSSETSVLNMITGPSLVYRDWLGTRTFKSETGEYNLLWASKIEEVRDEQEFIVTLKQGWKWSDGVEMTADDLVTTARIVADPDVLANSRPCAVTAEEEPIIYEKLNTYIVRIVYPKPEVNAIANTCYTMPAHIFGAAYDQGGAEAVKALWGIDTPLEQIVSGGPYLLSEYSPGQRLVLKKNPAFGQAVQAADGSSLPGPDEWIVTIVEDRNAQLALCSTGQCSFYYPTSLDEVSAMVEVVENGVVAGVILPEIGPAATTDHLFYNFNNTDICKSEMFSNTSFRQAINTMIDRQALIDAALGGLGFPGYDYQSQAAVPFDAPQLRNVPFEFDPERGVALLKSIGFTELGADGVLLNSDTGCRVEFDIQWNAGNTRRSQEVQIIAQTAAEYGVKINPKEVTMEVWNDAWRGTSLPRAHDFDAQIGALLGADIDNPAGINIFPIAANLNGWNKSKADAQPWEILIDRLSNQMNQELDLETRIAIYNERAQLMRDYLPLTPLVSLTFSFYHQNLGNVYPEDKLDANSIAAPYSPGTFRQLLTAP